MKPQVTHFGVANLDYCSYFLAGLEKHAAQGDIGYRVSRRLPQQLACTLENKRAEDSLSFYEVQTEHGSVVVCIDAHDNANYVHRRLVEQVDLYLKVNHVPTQWPRELTAASRRKIEPFSPYFPVAVSPLLHRPRMLPSHYWNSKKTRRHLRQLRQRPAIDALRALRNTHKSSDIVFVAPYYNEPQHQEINEFRYEVMCRLQERHGATSVIGFVGKSIPAPFARLTIPRVSMAAHLRRVAGARLGIYVHGVYHCLSYKLPELLTLGLPIAGQKLPGSPHRLEQLPEFDRQFAADSPQELALLASDLLADSEQLAKLSTANQRTFDQALAPLRTAQALVELAKQYTRAPLHCSKDRAQPLATSSLPR